jgi:hypothetical protein
MMPTKAMIIDRFGFVVVTMQADGAGAGGVI